MPESYFQVRTSGAAVGGPPLCSGLNTRGVGSESVVSTGLPKVMRLLIFSVLLASLALVPLSQATVQDELTDTTFWPTIKKEPIYFVKFYLKTCRMLPHCAGKSLRADVLFVPLSALYSSRPYLGSCCRGLDGNCSLRRARGARAAKDGNVCPSNATTLPKLL